MDFNLLPTQQISLRRISFDGFGCYVLDATVTPMSEADSQLFVELQKDDNLDQEMLTKVILKTITANKHLISREALARYGLG